LKCLRVSDASSIVENQIACVQAATATLRVQQSLRSPG
jgi:hypothetical protein